MQEILAKYQKFIKERNWEQFHTPKNLAVALSVEASELLEIFTWLTDEQSKNLKAERLQEVKDEMADVFLYLLRLADTLDVDLLQAVREKFVKVEQKYPLDKALAFTQSLRSGILTEE